MIKAQWVGVHIDGVRVTRWHRVILCHMVTARLFRYFPTMTIKRTDPNRQFSFALLARGFHKTCPQCGKGPLLTGYLKPQASCSACKEDFSHISADDGPAWLTLLIVGHAVVPLMLFFGRSDVVPLWLAILILAVVTLIGVYFILPRAKGIFIALIWLTGATGQNEFSDSPDLKD